MLQLLVIRIFILIIRYNFEHLWDISHVTLEHIVLIKTEQFKINDFMERSFSQYIYAK